MSAYTAKRALRAAAKVAFGAAFVGAVPGCGGRFEGDGSPGRVPGQPAPSFSGVAGASETPPLSAAGGAPETPPESGLRCLSEVALAQYPDLSTPVSASEAACCVAYDDAQITAAGDAGPSGALGADLSFVNCCKAIISGFGSGAIAYADVSGPVRDVCCSSGIVAPRDELWPQAFCSPWGPPVPPALSLDLEAFA